MKTANKSFIVQAALAGLFSMAVTASAQADAPKASDKPMANKKAPAKKGPEKVHCFGINTCKGKSECSVDGKSACNGQNACKGQGWMSLSRKTCMKKKGTIPTAVAPGTPAGPAAH